MAITAMGLGTKTALAGANLDPQAQFWSFLSAFCGKQVTTTTGSDEWSNRAWFSGFRARANDPTDMSVLIGGENGTIDSAVLWNAGSVVLLSTDGEAQKVTIPTAPSAGARYDAIVSYIDKSSADAETEKPGTPDYVKTIVVSGTAATSPDKPTDSQIRAKLPAGVGDYFRWCDVYVDSSTTNINDSNITDTRPASPNVYLAHNLFTTKRTEVSTRGDGQPLTVTAPAAPTGYKFLCWIGVTTNGFVGVGYLSDWDRANTNGWAITVNGTTGDYSITATALYQKTQL